MRFDAAKALPWWRTGRLKICLYLQTPLMSDLNLQERCLQIKVLNLLHSSAHLTHNMQVSGICHEL